MAARRLHGLNGRLWFFNFEPQIRLYRPKAPSIIPTSVSSPASCVFLMKLHRCASKPRLEGKASMSSFLSRSSRHLNLRFFSELQQPWEPEWKEVIYMTENYEVIRIDKGVREYVPAIDHYPYAGRKRTDFSDTYIIHHICSIIHRYGWGPRSIRELDSLSFQLNAFHISEAMRAFTELDTVMGIFSWIRQKRWYTPSAVLFTHLIERFGSLGDLETVAQLVKIMRWEDHCDLIPSTYNALIQCYAKASKLDEAYAYFAEMQKSGLQTDIFHINFLIESFCSAGLHQKALEIYQQIESAGCVADERTYKLLAPTLTKAGILDQACRLYYEMSAKGYHPDLSSYSSLIDGLASAGKFDVMMRIYGNAQTAGISPNPVIFATFVEGFAKGGKVEMAMSVFADFRKAGHNPSTATFSILIDAHIKAMQLDMAVQLYDTMVELGCWPTLGLVSELISSLLNAKQLIKARRLFDGMIAAEVLPTPNVCSALVDVHIDGGDLEAAIKSYQSIEHIYKLLLGHAKKNDFSDHILRTSQEMTEFKQSVDFSANNYLMKLLQSGGIEVAGISFQLMIEAGLEPNPEASRHLMEDCLKHGLFAMSKQALDQFLKSGSSPNLHIYSAILSSFTRCSANNQEEILACITKQEKILMSMLSSTGHYAHNFLCSLWKGHQQKKEALLDLVRSFLQRLETEADVQLRRGFVAVLLNYLVLMGQMKRARCVWKVAYERKLFPGRISFNREVVWSLDVRTLSVGTALTAVIHTLHRFRKEMVDYDRIPRRIRIVTGIDLRWPILDMLKPLDSPFETSGGGCLYSHGQHMANWFKQPFVEKFLEYELPSNKEIRL